MALSLSLSKILAKLQKQIESLRKQMDMHARQEGHHRDQRALLEAELRKAMGHLESFQGVAGMAAELDFPGMAPSAPPREKDLGPSPTLGRLVAWAVASRPEGERFGSKLVAYEINRHFPKSLRSPVDPGDRFVWRRCQLGGLSRGEGRKPRAAKHRSTGPHMRHHR